MTRSEILIQNVCCVISDSITSGWSPKLEFRVPGINLRNGLSATLALARFFFNICAIFDDFWKFRNFKKSSNIAKIVRGKKKKKKSCSSQVALNPLLIPLFDIKYQNPEP